MYHLLLQFPTMPVVTLCRVNIHSIRADRQKAIEVSSVCPVGLSRARKLFREKNYVVLSALKDKPRSPVWKMDPREGTKSEPNGTCYALQATGYELLRNQICSFSLFMSESPIRGEQIYELYRTM